MDAVISFLTDFGTADTSVGQCKGVIAAISPKALVVDISHAVPHYDVVAGSWMLRSAVPHFPACIHVAVVDPGVGTTRRPIAIECGRGDILIGPDNGLLLGAAAVAGGITGAVELADPAFRHQPVSNTFHARDIFCPAAAHLAHGVGIHLLGPNLDPKSLVQLPEVESTFVDGAVRTAVVGVNEFGSLALAAPGEMLGRLGEVSHVRAVVGDREIVARVVRTFGEASISEPLILVDSYGRLCLSLNQQDLAQHLGVKRADKPTVVLSPVVDDPRRTIPEDQAR
jgi:S-adenosylmethionine hydrolase